ncbi:hypothetical protein F6B93_22400 [Mycobacterium spongiae]|uniref:Uncharacterized protein n=1 Tax=Mycobacterium spongiae TaxID=886343 RepID=A0A975K159_9MYCO|nr:hypothetical protein F6B93_22400 [Mycobacterium spongiae]
MGSTGYVQKKYRVPLAELRWAEDQGRGPECDEEDGCKGHPEMNRRRCRNTSSNPKPGEIGR